jgi:hypothetical protein
VSRNKLILVSLAGMFMLAQSLYAQKSGVTYTLALQDYAGDYICDTFTVTVGTNNLATGTDNNYDCLDVGDNTWADGITSLPIGKFDGPGPEPLRPVPPPLQEIPPGEGIGPLALADNYGALELGGATTVIYFNFKTYTWTSYVESTGVGAESWANNGTFSIVEADTATRGKASAWAKPNDVVVTLPFYVVSGYPTGTYDLMLYNPGEQYEYCDFFQLTSVGDVVGGVHNFVSGDCYEATANAPAGGNYTFLPSGIEVISTPTGYLGVTGGRGLFTTDNGEEINYGADVTLNYYFDFQSSLWTLYIADSYAPGLQLVNWGTFVVVEDSPLTGKTVTHPVGGQLSTTPHSK